VALVVDADALGAVERARCVAQRDEGAERRAVGVEDLDAEVQRVGYIQAPLLVVV